MNEQIMAAVQEQIQEGMLSCAAAFRIVKDLDVSPLEVGRTADALETRLNCCQLGLFGYGERKSIVVPAEEVLPELEQAIRKGMSSGRLPCDVAWAIAAQFGMPKRHLANAAEKLEIRIGPCQLGAF